MTQTLLGLAWVAACAALVAALVVLARRMAPPLRYVLYAQAAYWAVSYVARPLFLLVVGPRPRPNDSLADFRLALGGYEVGIARVSAIVAAGLACYLVAVALAARLARPPLRPRWQTTWRFAATCYVVGWACRVALLSDVENPVTSTLSGAAPVAVGLLFLAVDWSDVSTRTRRTLLVVSGLGEFLYSVAYESKTPVLTYVLFVFLAYARQLRRRQMAVVLLGAGAVGPTVFAMLQSLKSTPGASRDLSVVDRTYPLYTRPLLPVLRRFDLFNAVADASFVPSGQWLDTGRFGMRLVAGTVPWLTDSPFISSGVRWAREVRAHTIRLNGSTVSLADGFIAEGYAAWGWVGVGGEALVVALVTVLVSRALLSSTPFLATLAIGVLTRPALFERGLLGLAESLGEALQVSVVLSCGWLMWEYAVQRGWSRRIEPLDGLDLGSNPGSPDLSGLSRRA